MTSNRPTNKPYEPRHKAAAIWLDAARARARKHVAPFKGRGSLDALGSAVKNGLVTYDEIDTIIASSESIHPDETPQLINRLWALNGMKHFPLQSIKGKKNKSITPPTFIDVLEEYIAQIDDVAKRFKTFLPDEHRKGYSHRDETYLDLFYNPGCRVSPDEYQAWIDQWKENGPSKETMHAEIATRVTIPNYEEVFDRWNARLSNPRRLTSNGIEYVKPRKSKKPVSEKIDVQQQIDALAAKVKVPEIEISSHNKSPEFDVDKLLRDVEALIDSGLSTKVKGVNSPNTSFSARVVARLAKEIYPIPKLPNPTELDTEQLRGAGKLYKKQLGIAENFQTEWSRIFTALNDISEAMYGQNLSTLDQKIIDRLALRSIMYIPRDRLNAGATQLVDVLKKSISSGPISEPFFDR